jgi:hypothetical protein
MRINKVSNTSALDSFFETMDRFNKKASAVGVLDDVSDAARAVGRVRTLSGLDLTNATHFRSLITSAGKEVSAIESGLRAALDGGNPRELIIFLRNAKLGDEANALILLAAKKGDPSILEDAGRHVPEAMRELRLMVEEAESARSGAHLFGERSVAGDPTAGVSAVRGGPSPSSYRGPVGAGQHVRVITELAEKSPEIRIFAEALAQLPETINGTRKARVAEHGATNVVIDLLENSPGKFAANPAEHLAPLADAGTEVSKNSSKVVRDLGAVTDAENAVSASSDAIASAPEAARAVEGAMGEAAVPAAKQAADGLEQSATDLVRLETAAAEAATQAGAKPIPAVAKHIDDTKGKIVADAKALEAAAGESKTLREVIRAGFAMKIAKLVGGAALLGGLYMASKHYLGGDDEEPGTSGTRGTIGDGASGASGTARESAEDLVRRYLETGDTAILTSALNDSKYSNLMIFPEPINGLSFAFFDSGRLRSPDERILVPTHPETQAILRSLSGNAGGKVLSYEESKALSPQDALNKAVQAIYQYGFYSTPLGNTRANKYIKGLPFRAFPQRGFLGRKAERIPPAVRRERQPHMGMTASDRTNKLNVLLKNSTDMIISTNNHENTDVTLFKEADEASKSYCKDAVKDLNDSGKSIREYFAGLGRLYDDKSEPPKKDFGSLYNVTEESGASLINSAHPKAVVVLDSIGDGGLVENGLEQSEKGREIAFSSPSGNFRSNYAWVRNVMKKRGAK